MIARVPNQKYLAYSDGHLRRRQRSFSSEYSRYSVVEAPCQRRGWLDGIGKLCWKHDTRLNKLLVTAAALSLCVNVSLAATRNLFEWSAVAPVVVAAHSLGENGKFVEMRVERVFRGDIAQGTILHLDLKQANRTRNRNLSRRALHLDPGADFLLLLEPSQRSGKRTTYSMVRGVDGARELPAEGTQAIFAALSRFIAIQDTKSDRMTWENLALLLDEPEPILLITALEQFKKFRRGEPELLLSLQPLLEHPDPEVREGAAQLVGQILGRQRDGEVIEEGALRVELVSRARRDPVVAVRIAATEALSRLNGQAVDEVLEQISDTDPDQAVRYMAEKLLHQRRKAARSSTARRGS